MTTLRTIGIYIVLIIGLVAGYSLFGYLVSEFGEVSVIIPLLIVYFIGSAIWDSRKNKRNDEIYLQQLEEQQQDQN